MSTKRIQVALAGASGYTGMETLRYLQYHPVFEVVRVYGNQSAGNSLDSIYPAYAGVYDMTILPLDDIALENADAVILALPHGRSAAAVYKLLQAGYKGKIIDIGSDFRLKTSEDYLSWYNLKHPHPELLDRFSYGLPEFNRFALRGSDYVANPGCFATAIQLGLLPLAINALTSTVHITGITGSSGSGASASPTTHFSTRTSNLKAYKVFRHQHLGEVGQQLGILAEKNVSVAFTPVSGPFVRGIWMTLSGELNQTCDLSEIFESVYYNAPMVRLRSELPELKTVAGSAFADIGWQQDADNFTIGVAIDNMGKGAAGQMIQNLNLMFDLPEETGLLHSGNIL